MTAKAQEVPLFSIVVYQYGGESHYGVIVAKTRSKVFAYNPWTGEVEGYRYRKFNRLFYSEFGSHIALVPQWN